MILPVPSIVPQATAGPENQSKGAQGGASFGQVLSGALDKVNNAQLEADGAVKKFLTGEIQDMHQVTIAMEQARLMMQLAVEVRNKVVEAYQEVSRMQV